MIFSALGKAVSAVFLLLSGMQTVTISARDGEVPVVFENHTDSICYLEYAPDGKSIFSATETELKEWDVASGRQLDSLCDLDDFSQFVRNKFKEQIEDGNYNCLTYSPDGTQYATASLFEIRIHRAKDDKLIRTISAGNLTDFSYDRRNGLIYAYEYLHSGSVLLGTDLKPQKIPRAFRRSCVNPVAFGGGAYYCKDSAIIRYDSTTKKQHTVFRSDDVNRYSKAAAVSESGRTLAYKSTDKIVVTDVDGKNRLFSVPCGILPEFGVSPSDSFFYLIQDGAAVVYDRGGKSVFSAEARRLASGTIRFSPDDELCTLPVNFGGKTVIYETKTWQPVCTLSGEAMCFSRDGCIVVRGMNKIKIYKAKSGELCSAFDSPGIFSSQQIFFSPDNERLLCITYGGAIRCLSVQTGELLSSTMAASDGSWITWTADGSITANRRGIRKFTDKYDKNKRQ